MTEHPPNCHCETCNAHGSVDCDCSPKDRLDGESERDWLKRRMCMYHWMQTDYYRGKQAEKTK